jgi:hypothetical protein
MSSKDVGLRIRVERGLREAFISACRAEGIGASEALREFMRIYSEHQQGGKQNSLFPLISKDRSNPD